VTHVRYISPYTPYYRADGTPAAGAALNFYVTGTSNREITYNDRGLTIPNKNPIILDELGSPGNVYLAPGRVYHAILNDTDGTTIFDLDDIVDFVSATSTPTHRYVTPYYEYSRSDGSPIAGGHLFFYATGTTTPATTWSDEALTIQNSSPIVLNAKGSPGSIFLARGSTYRAQLKDIDGTIVFDFDPVISYESTI